MNITVLTDIFWKLLKFNKLQITKIITIIHLIIIFRSQVDQEIEAFAAEMIDRFGLLPDQTKNLFSVTELKLKAEPLGIKKIEAGPTGGRLIFSEKPNIDPIKIIDLIQKQNKLYKLDGQDKLRFIVNTETAEARIKAVENTLNQLS